MNLWILVAAAALMQTPQVEIQTLSGGEHSGTLTQLSADGAVVTTTDGGSTITADDLLMVRFADRDVAPPPRSSLRVSLTDGSMLPCTSFTLASQKANLFISGLEELTISSRSLDSVRLGNGDGPLGKMWQELRQREFDKDAVIIRRGEVLDHLTGVIGDVDDKSVKFLLDNDEIDIPLDRVYGLIFYHRTPRKTRTVCGIALTNGGKLLARSVELAEDGLKVRPAAGGSLAIPLDGVESLDFSNGKVVYLSDLEPRDVNYVPYFDITWKYRRDRNLDGGPLRLGRKTYAKGLAIHSRTQLEYRLRGDYRRFRAVMGIDRAVEGRGHVQVVISADGNVLLDTTVKGTDDPRPLDLDVTGVRDLTILVDFGEDLDIADHLDLADARVTK